MTSQTQNSPSLTALLQDLRNETSTLLRQEVSLAKAELSEKATRLTSNAVQLAIGGFVAYAGLIVLLFGFGDLLASLFINLGMDADLAAWLAPSLVGLIVALIGVMMLAKAKKALSADKLVPEQTIESLRENKAWAQTKMRHSHEQQPAI